MKMGSKKIFDPQLTFSTFPSLTELSLSIDDVLPRAEMK